MEINRRSTLSISDGGNNNRANLTQKMNKFYFFGIFIYYFLFLISFLFLFQKYSILENSLDSLRLLNENKNSNKSNDIFDKIQQSVLVEPLLMEINNKIYKGTWEIKSEEDDHEINPFLRNYFSDFKNKEGSLTFTIHVVDESIFTGGGVKKIQIEYEMKDGEYKEHWVSIKQQYLHYNNQNLNRNDLEFVFSPVTLIASITAKGNIKLDSWVTKMRLYEIEETYVTHATHFNLTFSSTNHKTMAGNLQFEDMSINLDFKGEEMQSNTSKKVNNFTLILTFIGFLHTYHSLVLLRESILETINPKSFSILFISLDMMWNSILSIGTFYISTSVPSFFNDFALPSLIYFVNFSVFQIRFLFILWRHQNIENIDEETAISLRRKMTKFYMILYLSLFISLFSIYFILIYKWILMAIVAVTFLPQIYHNCTVNISRNRIPIKTIFLTTINRIYFPIYYLMCPKNIFEAEPHTLMAIIGLISIFTQIVFLFLQMSFGGLFFIPKSCRKGYYNYFRTIEDIKSFKSDFETYHCSICLSAFIEEESTTIDPGNAQLVSTSGIDDMPLDSNKQAIDSDYYSINVSSTNCRDKLRNFIRRKQKGKKVDKLMVTPCKHIFHPECLRVWSERKNECPVCRKPIPCIDE